MNGVTGSPHTVKQVVHSKYIPLHICASESIIDFFQDWTHEIYCHMKERLCKTEITYLDP